MNIFSTQIRFRKQNFDSRTHGCLRELNFTNIFLRYENFLRQIKRIPMHIFGQNAVSFTQPACFIYYFFIQQQRSAVYDAGTADTFSLGISYCRNDKTVLPICRNFIYSPFRAGHSARKGRPFKTRSRRGGTR